MAADVAASLNKVLEWVSLLEGKATKQDAKNLIIVIGTLAKLVLDQEVRIRELELRLEGKS